MFKTPNKWHYMPLVARITPHWFHPLVCKMRGRAEVDTFPTLYRANKAADISRLAAGTSLEVISINRVEGRPEYLRINFVTYCLGIIYERLVNAHDSFAAFRVLLIGTLKKRER